MSDIEKQLDPQPHSAHSAEQAEGDAAGAVGDTAPGALKQDAHGATVGSAEIEGDLDELVSVAAQRDEYLALAQRTQADFENYRKRVAREAALAQERGVAALAKELLPALDNLDRALGAAAQDDPLLDGVRLVRADLGSALARLGVESFSPLGEAFDPSLHEAIATVPNTPEGTGGETPSGVVAEVYQDGYRLAGNVIRPARVVVTA